MAVCNGSRFSAPLYDKSSFVILWRYNSAQRSVSGVRWTCVSDSGTRFTFTLSVSSQELSKYGPEIQTRAKPENHKQKL